MKGTKFSEPFMSEIDYWERGLSLVLEVLEQTLNVQRQWMYLGEMLCYVTFPSERLQIYLNYI